MKKIVFLFSLFVLSSNYAFADVNHAEAKELISQFYKQHVFGNGLDKLDADRIGTSRFLKKLERAYGTEYDCEEKPCYGIWALRTGAQDGEGVSFVSNIQPKSNGWYRVNYRDMGFKGTTDVKVIEKNGVIKIDDYKKVFDGSR